MNTKFLLVLLLLVTAFSLPVAADTLSYAARGTEASSSTFVATTTGTITAYFVSSGAAFTSVIGMTVNGAAVSTSGLNNHASSAGEALVLGNVNAGDVVTFNLFVENTKETWSSDKAANADGFNHVYASSFGGNEYIPSGTFVGFEDLYGGGDEDYDDIQFVFTNTAAKRSALALAAVPEPACLSLVSLGLASVMMRRKKR